MKEATQLENYGRRRLRDSPLQVNPPLPRSPGGKNFLIYECFPDATTQPRPDSPSSAANNSGSTKE